MIFRSGLSFMEAIECSGYPSTNRTNENVSHVKELILKNRRITVREVADMLGISFQSLQSNWPESEHIGWVFPPWQCACSLCFVCACICNQKKIDCLYTPFLLTRFSTPCDFFLSPKIQDNMKG